jgi:hypothetical protein
MKPKVKNIVTNTSSESRRGPLTTLAKVGGRAATDLILDLAVGELILDEKGRADVAPAREGATLFTKSVLLGGFAGGTIEAMEKRGQEEFVESDILPTDIQDPYVLNKPIERGSGRKLLESWGFKFGKPIGGDTIFTQAKLPLGWTKKATDHDMWSKILDDQGRERCGIFYKAAFYDRSAHMNITPRYRIDVELEDSDLRRAGRSRGAVKEGEKVLFVGEWRSNPTEGDNYTLHYGGYDQAQKDAKEWFAANLPSNIEEQWLRP